MDIPSISAALSSLKTAADIAKLIKDSGTTLEQAEIKLKIADLVSSLADARIKISEVREALSDKDAEIKELRAKLQIHNELIWEAPYYWLGNEAGKDGPYCQHCYDTGKNLVRLQGKGNGYWRCMSCKNGYTDKAYKTQNFAISSGAGDY